MLLRSEITHYIRRTSGPPWLHPAFFTRRFIYCCSRLTFGLVLVSALAGIAFAQPVSFNFEGGQTTWRPRSAGVTLSLAQGLDATGQGKSSLHLKGRQETGWNYAVSPPEPIKAGGLYRFSAWLRVNKLGPTTPAPFLKCEFVPTKPKTDLGRVDTSAYDVAKMGQWQQVSLEFRAPAGVKNCWFAVEKGTNSPTAIDAYLDDVTLQPLARLTVLEKYRLNPVPETLQRMRGVHPRLYLTKEKIARLREAVKTTHAQLLAAVLAQADQVAKKGPPAYILRDKYSGDEQLWQRNVGNDMPLLAMAYVVTGKQKYLDAARAFALASCSYPTWGLGGINGMDLAAGHQLYGLGIVYDWCYDGLGEQARKTIRDTLTKRASAMFEAAATGRAWWRNSYLQNHLWVDACGLAVAGFALYGEVNQAELWIGLSLDKFKTTMAWLGPDGASQEGVGYWEYGVEYMLKFMALARQLLGVNMYDNDWWRHTADYALYMSLPRHAWTRSDNIVDIADCPRGHWYGPDYLLRELAREYRDPHAQWLAQQVDEAKVDAPAARWLNLLWYDPTLAPHPPTDLPTMHHFSDLDIVSARSGWSGDESLVVFKCGPFIGRRALHHFSYDPGGGHVHPDANHFVIFGDGEWLIRDDGYRAKWTGQHNTLLIDAKGQLGEGHMWFDGSQCLKVKADPKITLAVSSPGLDQMTGDATEAYPRDLGLQHYIRHLLYLKPDVLIVIDEIDLAAPQNLELRFHPEQTKAEAEGAAFLMRGKSAVLRVEPLTPAGVSVKAETLAAQGREGQKPSPMFTISLRTRSAAWRDAVAFSWSKAGASPAIVTLDRHGDLWTFHAGGRTVRFDWRTGQAD